jgi:arabinofuranosyltransferase
MIQQQANCTTIDDRTGITGFRLKIAVVVVLFSVFFYLNSYICDDAFMFFRTVDNLVRGFGLRWNVLERVQVFTSPLYTMILSLVYWFTYDSSWVPNPDRIYWTAILLAYAFSLSTMCLLAGCFRKSSPFYLCFAILFSSQAFSTFTSSGLETPVSYLLLALFWSEFFRSEFRSGVTRYHWLMLWAALCVLNRMDTALLVGPAAAVRMIEAVKADKKRMIKQTAFASLPLVMWFSFSLLYYGFLLPNTYAAKVGNSVNLDVLLNMGGRYFQTALKHDPITLTAIGFGCLAASMNRKTWVLGIGCLSYVFYIVSIGGDFLGFRFLALPLLCLVFPLYFCFSRMKSKYAIYISIGACTVYSILLPSSPLRTAHDLPAQWDVRLYYPGSNLTRWSPGRNFPFDRFHTVRDPEHCRQSRLDEPRITVSGGGLSGFCSGPLHHMIDPIGITDPLMARLKLNMTEPFVPAHIMKEVPEGYRQTLESKSNRFRDPVVAEYYDRVWTLTSGDLFSRERFGYIWQLNFAEDRMLVLDQPVKYKLPLPLNIGD